MSGEIGQLTNRQDITEKDGKLIKIESKKILAVLCCLLGFLTVLIGILCATYNIPQKFVDKKFQSVLTLSPDSDIYQDWTEPPVPIYMKFYLFNVTNPNEVIEGERPKLQERGPYTYRMVAPKTNVTFHPNSTVSYYNNYQMHFVPSMSTGSVDDELSLLNVPLASMAVMMKKSGYQTSALGMMNELVKYYGGDKLFPKRTPNEILFGYRDPVFVLLNSFGILDEVNFGFFMKFNNSDDGSFLVYTGQTNPERTFQIAKWNGNESLSFWNSEQANMINGSDGSFLGQSLKKDDTPYLYFPQMCRSMKLEYDGEAEVKGVHTLRFRGAKDLLANSTVNPANAGFCVPEGNCYDSGVLNTETCMEGAPGFISQPHFLNAAEKYQNAVLGLSPNSEKHESYYYAEPKTGAVLKSHRRLQINILMQSSNTFDDLVNVQDTIFPVLWMEGNAEVNDETANSLSIVLKIAKYIWISSYILIGCGILGMIISIRYGLSHRERHVVRILRRISPFYGKSKNAGLDRKLSKGEESGEHVMKLL